jgi:nucleoside-diphosphate-sugar epimerase
MSAPKRIFITGISSSILSGLCKSLQEENHELIGLSRNKFVRKGIQIIQGDLQDPSSWNKEVQHCDLIIHAAAITHTHDESKYYSVNYEASKKLIDACPKSAGFVFISSRTAGEKSGAYGHSKWMAEEYLKEIYNSEPFRSIRFCEEGRNREPRPRCTTQEDYSLSSGS